MRAAFLLALLSISFSLSFAASGDYQSPLSVLEQVLKNSDFSIFQSIFGVNASNFTDAAGMASAFANGSAPEQSVQADGGMPFANAIGSGQQAFRSIEIPKPPTIVIPASQLRLLAALAALLFYVFAAGKLADALQSSGRPITKREALFAPFALLATSGIAVAFYFLSGAARPPQDTLITNLFYLVLVPAGIMVGAGAAVIYAMFRDRLSAPQSLDLAVRIVFAPVFDGLRGYWTALGALAILGLISAAVFYSTGGRLALATLDFIILSAIAAAYYAYQAFVSQGNEAKAANVVTALCLLAPSLLQAFFKATACAILAMVPFGIFPSCPLDTAGSEVSLALSVGATMLLLVPIVPFIYAFSVNLLRAWTLFLLLARPGRARGDEENSDGEGDSPEHAGPRPRIGEWKPASRRARKPA